MENFEVGAYTHSHPKYAYLTQQPMAYKSPLPYYIMGY